MAELNKQPENEITQNGRKSSLPNFHLSVKLKYVKLGYHYLISHVMYLFVVPILAIVSAHLSTLTAKELHDLSNLVQYNLLTVFLCFTLLIFLSTIYFMTRPGAVYLLDFVVYKPDAEGCKCTREIFIDRSRLNGGFTEENMAFQKKVLERSGLGNCTYLPESLLSVPPTPCIKEARKEAEMVTFGVIDQLFAKTSVNPKDIGILVVSSSTFNPIPSLSAMIVNRYKLRGNINSFNLGGMGFVSFSFRH